MSLMSDFVNNNDGLLIWISLNPITGIRYIWNMFTYNEIYDTRFIPGIQNWQKGGNKVNLDCTFTFWWIKSIEDTVSIKLKKK